MHATIDVRLIASTTTKRYPGHACRVHHRQNVESVLLESMVESLDAIRIEALCGEKQANGSGGDSNEPALMRAPLSEQPVNMSLIFIMSKTTAADQDETSYFRPVEAVLNFNGQNPLSTVYCRYKRRSRYVTQLS